MPQLSANSLIQDGRIALDPAPDRDVVNGEVPLGHDLLEIAVRERVSEAANAQKNNHVFEMPPVGQCWPSSGHDTPYQIRSAPFANTPKLFLPAPAQGAI